MHDWKRVKIDFKTVKLGDFIEPVKMNIAKSDKSVYGKVYGVTNTEGIVKTGKKASADISKYIIIDKNYFAYNPYRINVGSIGVNLSGLKGCVSPAYVVFKTKKGLDPVFLWYYLKSDFGNHLINWYGNRGGVRNALRYDDLCKIDIPEINYEKQLEVISKVDHYNNENSKIYKELEQQEFLLKQLRQSILQEAVEGKLTAKWRKQNPDLISGENHAARLLEKINAEKEQLIREGKIKKQKALPPINDDEKPFELPEEWVWCRLGEVTEIKGGKRVSNGYKLLKYPTPHIYIRVTDMKNGTIDDSDLHYINEQMYQNIRQYTISKDDLYITIVGATIGKCGIVPEKFDNMNLTENAAKIIIHQIDKYFLLSCLNSQLCQNQFIDKTKQVAVQKMALNRLSTTLFPIPPLAEQQAIVEKVDRLIAKINALEEQVKSRKAQAGQLMQAVLREAFNGE